MAEFCNFYIQIFAFLGVLTLIYFVFDTIWSLLQGIRGMLAPHLLSNDANNLIAKFGSWACE